MLLLDVFNDDWLNEATVDSCAHDPHPLAASHATARLAELNAMERPPHNMTYVELHLMELEAESQSHDALGPIRSPSPAFTDWLMSEDDEPGCTTFHKTPGHSQLHSYNVSSQAHASVERSPTPLNGTTSPIPMDKASRAALLAEADTLPLRLPNLESLRIRSMIDDRANDQSPKKKARVKKPEMRVSATTIHASIQPAQYNNDAPSDVDGVAVDVDSLLGLQSNVASAPRVRLSRRMWTARPATLIIHSDTEALAQEAASHRRARFDIFKPTKARNCSCQLYSPITRLACIQHSSIKAFGSL